MSGDSDTTDHRRHNELVTEGTQLGLSTTPGLDSQQDCDHKLTAALLLGHSVCVLGTCVHVHICVHTYT